MTEAGDARYAAPETSRCNGSEATTRLCLECIGPFASRQASTAFCCDACRTTWHTRRRDRGLELYDLYMAHRFERAEATAAHVMSIINARVSDWRAEDKATRAGRRSWQALAIVLAARPHYRAIAVRAETRREAKLRGT